jgi:hypothetical protein
MLLQYEDEELWAGDEPVVSPGDDHDRGVETLCVGEAR